MATRDPGGIECGVVPSDRDTVKDRVSEYRSSEIYSSCSVAFFGERSGVRLLTELPSKLHMCAPVSLTPSCVDVRSQFRS